MQRKNPKKRKAQVSEQEQLFDELQKNFPLQRNGMVSREAILQQLALSISNILQQNPDGFFQLMYRLDIPEHKLQEALNDGEHSVWAVAELIYQRQWQKISARHNPLFNDDCDDDDLKW